MTCLRPGNNFRRLAWVWSIVFGLWLAGCTSTRQSMPVLHGFDVRNVGSEPVSDVLVRYGAFSRPFCDNGIPCRPKYGVFYGEYMPIQDAFTVTWKTADGQEHRALVQVRRRLQDASRLQVLALRLDGPTLRVEQWLKNSDATRPLEFEKLPLYP